MATLLVLPGLIFDYKHQPRGEMSIYIIWWWLGGIIIHEHEIISHMPVTSLKVTFRLLNTRTERNFQRTKGKRGFAVTRENSIWKQEKITRTKAHRRTSKDGTANEVLTKKTDASKIQENGSSELHKIALLNSKNADTLNQQLLK